MGFNFFPLFSGNRTLANGEPFNLPFSYKGLGLSIWIKVVSLSDIQKPLEITFFQNGWLIGLDNEIDNIFNAILLCRSHFSIAKAIIKPPINKKII